MCLAPDDWRGLQSRFLTLAVALVLATALAQGCAPEAVEDSQPVAAPAEERAPALDWSSDENFEISAAFEEAGITDCGEVRWVADAMAQGEWLAQCRPPDVAGRRGAQWSRELRVTRNWYRNTYRVFEQPVGSGF